jgi:hypothetical protein
MIKQVYFLLAVPGRYLESGAAVAGRRFVCTALYMNDALILVLADNP